MDDVKYFPYGEKELAYLRKKDKKLSAVINRVGHIERAVDDDLFSARGTPHRGATDFHKGAGNRLGARAERPRHGRCRTRFGLWRSKFAVARHFVPQGGIHHGTSRKRCIRAICLISIGEKPDEAVILELSALKGIGVWTAEMLLLFCLQRPNVFSYGDLAILRGMRMVYRHKEINRARFERYRKRFSPYCSIASLYFWAVSGGALP